MIGDWWEDISLQAKCILNGRKWCSVVNNGLTGEQGSSLENEVCNLWDFCGFSRGSDNWSRNCNAKMEKFDQTTSQSLVKMFAKRKTAAATNALSTEILMFSNLVITSSKCVQWPECLDWKVVQELMDCYTTASTLRMVDHFWALNYIKMGPREEPSVLSEHRWSWGRMCRDWL